MAEEESTSKISILFVTADPSGPSHLRLSREEREIRTELQASVYRHRFEFLISVSARSQDLSWGLLQCGVSHARPIEATPGKEVTRNFPRTYREQMAYRRGSRS